jgi:alpha-2-macroglobulin-like protein
LPTPRCEALAQAGAFERTDWRDSRPIFVGTFSAVRERMLEGTRLTLTWGLCLGLAAVGCSNDGPSSGAGRRPVDGREPADAADQPSNGAVEVDEVGLHAVARDGELELSIPVRGLKAGKGSVTAELVAVDRSKVEAQAELGYRLDEGERRTLTARLRLPKDLNAQADLVAYSVRVHDGESSLQVTRSLLYVLSPIALRLEGPSALQAEKQGSYRVRAQHPLTREPLADVPVSLAVKREDQSVQTLQGETDDTGSAIFDVNVEEPGSYSVNASSEGAAPGLAPQLSGPINVKASGQKVLLTTDKPIYQPGQTIHLRAMALKNPGNTPLASTALLFEVLDGKGNKVFKKQRKTDEYGIASVDFKLASLVNMGSYKLQVTGDGSAEKTVEVSRYVLPKFELRVTTDRPWYAPGRELQGTVDGRYFFGKTLSGADVTIEALSLDVGAQVFQRVMGKTDAQGHFAFTIQLPESLAGIPLQDGNALVSLRTRVTDSAGQVVEKDTPVTVAAAGVRLSLVPEAAELVTGIENRFHLFATDPLGAPIADAEVELSGGAPEMTVRTDAFGHAELRWTVEADTQADTILAELTTREGEKTSGSFAFRAQTGAEHVLVRTDKSLYALGESVKVQVLGTRDESRAYLDWLNDGQVVDMRTLELKDGVASFEVTLDPTLIGENRIEAYVVDEDGNVVRAGRTIVVNREGGLRVALTQDKAEYRPGEPAQLTLSVTDETGKPTPAALGVQIVDEAVFGLIDARPGLLRTFFELEDSFAMPTYEIHVPAVNFEKLLFEDALATDPEQKRAAQVQAEAQLSALRGRPMMGLSLESWSATASAASAKLNPYVDKERKRLVELLEPAFKAARPVLAALGCTEEMGFCSSLGKTFLRAWSEQALSNLELVDFWGNVYDPGEADSYLLTLNSNGPDETRGDTDDLAIQVYLSELSSSPRKSGSSGGDFGAAPGQSFAMGGAAAGSAASAPPPQQASPTPVATTPSQPNGSGAQDAGAPEGESTSGSSGPRVRKAFPETLYVNPALITDAEGKASVSLDMADSITSWRVSALANAKGGALGGGQAAVTVFQDFFVDINFPAELTRGDQVEFPIVVYNYLKSEQTVRP